MRSRMRLRIMSYAIAWAATGFALVIIVVLLQFTHHPWLLPSLGGSCVILFGMPTSDMARMRSLIGGHIIAATTGLVFLQLGAMVGGSPELWMIASVATALALMMATQTIHSPAGANPGIVFAEHASWGFLVSPLLIGLAVLAIAALLYRRFWEARVLGITA